MKKTALVGLPGFIVAGLIAVLAVMQPTPAPQTLIVTPTPDPFNERVWWCLSTVGGAQDRNGFAVYEQPEQIFESSTVYIEVYQVEFKAHGTTDPLTITYVSGETGLICELPDWYRAAVQPILDFTPTPVMFPTNTPEGS